jgi:hypothetical protein
VIFPVNINSYKFGSNPDRWTSGSMWHSLVLLAVISDCFVAAVPRNDAKDDGGNFPVPFCSTCSICSTLEHLEQMEQVEHDYFDSNNDIICLNNAIFALTKAAR